MWRKLTIYHKSVKKSYYQKTSGYAVLEVRPPGALMTRLREDLTLEEATYSGQ